MGLPAKFNDYGSHTYNRNGVWKRKYTVTKSNGSVEVRTSTGAVTLPDGSCIRSGYKKNPIKETSVGFKYRSDSGYQRHITVYEVAEGNISSTYKTFEGTVLDEYEGYYMAPTPNVQGLWYFPVTGGTGAGGWSPQWLSEGRDRARTECLNKLNDSKVDLGAFCGEALESGTMLANSMINLGRILKQIRNGNYTHIPREFGVVKRNANIYLEYIYGWKPLVEDTYRLYNLTKEALLPDQIVKADRTVRTSYHKDRNRNQSLRDIRNQADVIHRCHLRARLSDVWRRGASRVGVDNPAASAWELIPYSFLIDWGMPIGNFLSALTASNGLEFMSGYESQVIEAEASATCAKVDLNSKDYSGSLQTITGKGWSFMRNGFTGFPRPLVYGKSPFSTAHFRNAIALWASLRG